MSDMSLIHILRDAKGRGWITGREPSDDTLCIRITEKDRRRLLRVQIAWAYVRTCLPLFGLIAGVLFAQWAVGGRP
jgi:hypothetical protein